MNLGLVAAFVGLLAKPAGKPPAVPKQPPPVGPLTVTETPARFGTLSLRVQPADAEVLIDGEKWTGPAESQRLNIKLAAGQHSLEVRKAGYVTYTERILVRADTTMTLNISMTRIK